MEQITREEMIGLLSGLVLFADENDFPSIMVRAKAAIAALQAVEPAMVIEVSRGVHGTPAYEELFFNESLENGRHELFTLPCPPAKALSEMQITYLLDLAAEECDGLASEWDSDDVVTDKNYAQACADRIRALDIPQDLLNPQPAQAQVPEERKAFEVWAEHEGLPVMPDGETYYNFQTHIAWVAWRSRAMLTASPAPEHSRDGNKMVAALRQYRHNDDSGFVFAYDKEQTDRIVAGLVEALEQIAESRDVGRHDGKPEDGPMLTATEMWLIAQEALNTYHQQEEAER